MKKKSWNETYNAYLQRKHSKFQTNKDSIGQVVFEATKSSIKSIEKIVEGEVNEVYDVLTQDNKKVIVRISRRKAPSFETEQKYVNKVRKLGVPAPNILLVKRVSENLTFCVEEKIDGKTFRDIENSISKPEKRKIILLAGNILSKIHSIKVDKFGTLSHDSYSSWTKVIREVERNPKNPLQYKDESVNQKNVDRGIKIILDNLPLFEIKIPQLLHSDYGTKHWLVNKGQITGILDFEGVKGGDPLYDFGWVDFFQGDNVDIKLLLEGYENRDNIKDNFDFKIKLYKLVLSLRILEYYISEENIGGIQHCVTQLDKTLKYFS